MNEPAFPIKPTPHLIKDGALGLTKLEYATIELIKGLLSNPEVAKEVSRENNPDEVIDVAIVTAKAAFQKLSQEKP